MIDKIFAPEAVQEAIEIIRSEFLLGIWETFYVTVLATAFAIVIGLPLGVLLVVGMMLFSVGADMAMQPMGEKMGARITKTRKLWLILSLGFLLGFKSLLRGGFIFQPDSFISGIAPQQKYKHQSNQRCCKKKCRENPHTSKRP